VNPTGKRGLKIVVEVDGCVPDTEEDDSSFCSAQK